MSIDLQAQKQRDLESKYLDTVGISTVPWRPLARAYGYGPGESRQCPLVHHRASSIPVSHPGPPSPLRNPVQPGGTDINASSIATVMSVCPPVTVNSTKGCHVQPSHLRLNKTEADSHWRRRTSPVNPRTQVTLHAVVLGWSSLLSHTWLSLSLMLPRGK